MDYVLSREFSKELKKILSEEDFKELVKKNSNSNKGFCFSHDYCDANVAMIEAVKTVVDRDADLRNEDTILLINNAWGLAKQNSFYIKTNNRI